MMPDILWRPPHMGTGVDTYDTCVLRHVHTHACSTADTQECVFLWGRGRGGGTEEGREKGGWTGDIKEFYVHIF